MERLCLSLCDVGCPSIPGASPLPQKRDFWAVQAILSNICFQDFFFTQNSTSKKIFPLSLFYAFLDVSCHPECSKILFTQIFFHLKFFFNELGWSKAWRNATKHSSLHQKLCSCAKVTVHLFQVSKSAWTAHLCWSWAVLNVKFHTKVNRKSAINKEKKTTGRNSSTLFQDSTDKIWMQQQITLTCETFLSFLWSWKPVCAVWCLYGTRIRSFQCNQRLKEWLYIHIES